MGLEKHLEDYKLYNVIPDIAIFVHWEMVMQLMQLLEKDVMDFANSTFISSTFWTERIGSVAGLKTLEIMKKNKSWKRFLKLED